MLGGNDEPLHLNGDRNVFRAAQFGSDSPNDSVEIGDDSPAVSRNDVPSKISGDGNGAAIAGNLNLSFRCDDAWTCSLCGGSIRDHNDSRRGYEDAGQ